MPATTWSDLRRAHEQRWSTTRHDGVPEHRPVAAVLGCADARVPPSILFAQPPGMLFEVRIAGNIAGPAALASLDYAVQQLGVELVVVLGHTYCGAVAAVVEGGDLDGYAAILEPIREVARQHPDEGTPAIVEHNVAQVVAELRTRYGDAVTVQGAVHDLETGRLQTVDR